jgi:hypothetical protein
MAEPVTITRSTSATPGAALCCANTDSEQLPTAAAARAPRKEPGLIRAGQFGLKGTTVVIEEVSFGICNLIHARTRESPV